MAEQLSVTSNAEIPQVAAILQHSAMVSSQYWVFLCIILTATTNAAVAQITETILSLDAFADLAVCRYIAESVVFDDSIAATPADMHEVLKRLPDLYRNELEEEALDECERFRDGRIVFEAHMQNRERQEFLTEQEREDLVLAEKDVSDLIDKVVEVMFLNTSRTPPDAVINIKSNPIPPHVGYVALLADDKVSRGQWNYDLVEKVRFGKDISIKSLDVRTQNVAATAVVTTIIMAGTTTAAGPVGVATKPAHNALTTVAALGLRTT
ncbi:unnamed protein product [Heligmosomoides polygyrus]|uniref:FAS1 domain-containing protein n=1 Tax=Heligmosomoides polygyrus TaxID=6339 RepID=A0A3P8D954_HELPZ|nr:unnamed protein product [Heligmosomoides polygyrus]